MRARFEALRDVERALIRGRLVDAKVSARDIANARDEHELTEWAAQASVVRGAAARVAKASSADQALRELPAVAVACAECHIASGRWPALASAPPAPADATLVLRMARHQWATDRLWSGLVGGSEASWRAGLEVLATTPPPFAIVDADKVSLGRQLQAYATAALRSQPNDSLEQRAHAYGEMLVICAACHETPPRP
ncbi:hypothetical protein BH11MYX1_BH11MYX1_09820 [soil metagenome]